MKMQIKAGFVKEWLYYSRTFRFGGTIIALVSYAFANPLLYRLILMMYSSILNDPDMSAQLGESAVDTFDMAQSVLSSASVVFPSALNEICVTGMLVVMILLMAAAGGEQKKRATIIPAAAGLDYFSYLVPKFVLYPGVVAALTFVCGTLSGFMCNALFPDGHIGAGTIMLASLLCAVYTAFITAVYISIGVCTSRPGVVTVLMVVGTSLVMMILMQLQLTQFQPFTLRTLCTGEMFAEDFDLAANVPSIIVGAALSVVIGVIMFFLAYAVLKAKKINNREDAPEF